MLVLMMLGLVSAVSAVTVGLLLVVGVLKVALRLLLLPLLLLKLLIGGLVFLTLGPILVAVGVVVMVALAAALVAPLLPLAALAFVVWLVVTATRRPAFAGRI